MLFPFLFFDALFVLSAIADIPSIGGVSLGQDNSERRTLTVSYSLTAPAIVTVDFQTNALADASGAWISIGAGNFTTVTGDVNRLVQPTAGELRRTIKWDARTEWPDVKVGAPCFRAALTAWPTNSPPDYMVIDLRPSDVYPVRYYVSDVALPYGPVTNRIYKDELLVLKRIRAKGVVWLRGAGEQVKNWYSDPFGNNWATYSATHCQHPVMLTRDYYIGIYEITQGQYWRVMGGSEPSSPRFAKLAVYSRDGSYNSGFRGGNGDNWPTLDNSGELDYAASHYVTSASFFGRLRARAEVGGFYDLPTDAQWEYACRAGTDEPFPANLDKTTISAVYANACRYSGNEQTADCEGVTGTSRATVGSYAPNPWGLYDMAGNAAEFVLDHYGDARFTGYNPNKVLVDPFGSADTSTKICVRGGYSQQGMGYCNAVYCDKGGGSPTDVSSWGGRVTMDIH